MTNILARLLSVAVLGAAVTGCATVPYDGYYEPASYYSNSYNYSNAPGYVYGAPAVYPGYAPSPSVIYYGANDRDDRWDPHRHPHRNDWRERERHNERVRAERDRQARERDRDLREQHARERERARAERERDRNNPESRPGRLAPDSYTPHPHDWRSRQQSNSPDKP